MKRSPEDIAELFDYGRWATGRTLDATAVLSPEEFTRPIGGSFGSVQGTFTHLWGADWVWLERVEGRSPASLPPGVALTSNDAVRERYAGIHAAQQKLAAALTPARLSEKLTYVNFAGQTCAYSLADALVHVVNHGTYHRGQIATLLRQLGKTPAPTDYLRYIDARG
ncbi:MAG TPA: DinB family protein [Thermoanaerobaculia bacterium]|nr:DinB family protein [Thermoanaerobaculia bacterium]